MHYLLLLDALLPVNYPELSHGNFLAWELNFKQPASFSKFLTYEFLEGSVRHDVV